MSDDAADAARAALVEAEERLAQVQTRVDRYEKRLVEDERFLRWARKDTLEARWVHYDAAHRVSACPDPDCGALPGEPCRDLNGVSLQRQPGHYGSSTHHSIRKSADEQPASAPVGSCAPRGDDEGAGVGPNTNPVVSGAQGDE